MQWATCLLGDLCLWAEGIRFQNKNILLSAVHWPKMYETPRTTNWNSANCCTACHVAWSQREKKKLKSVCGHCKLTLMVWSVTLSSWSKWLTKVNEKCKYQWKITTYFEQTSVPSLVTRSVYSNCCECCSVCRHAAWHVITTTVMTKGDVIPALS